MNIKGFAVAAVALLALAVAPAAMAKQEGTLVKFPNWGIITVPDNLYMERSDEPQPMLFAKEYGNDVIAMLEQIYPVQPESYQLVQKDDAYFQYGYMLHYTVSRWEIEAAIDRDKKSNSYLREIGAPGARPDYASLAQRANTRLKTSLPVDFRLVKPVTPRKVKGKTFYEWMVQRDMVINGNRFLETVQGIAWTHGDTVEIALIFGNIASDYNIIATVQNMMETAQKLPKK